MHDQNHINSSIDNRDQAVKSSEGFHKPFDFENDLHELFDGHIIHKLAPEAALQLPIHEATRLFSINQADVDRLKKSIDQFGQQIPVVLYDDKVLDGRCRIRACTELELPVLAIRFCESDLKGLTLTQWVLHRNRAATDGRRMSDTEYALIVAEVYGSKETERAQQRKQGGTPVEEELCGETHEVLGTIFGLSPNLMKQALKVFRSGDTELLQMVKKRELSLSKAVAISKLSNAQRQAAKKEPKKPLPAASSNKVLARYKNAVKSLKKFHQQVTCIAQSKQISADAREAIEPPLIQIRDSVVALEKVKTLKAPSTVKS